MRTTSQHVVAAVVLLAGSVLQGQDPPEPKAARKLGELTVFSTPGRYGYIDSSGQFALTLNYETLGSFSEGLAAVMIRWDWQRLDAPQQGLLADLPDGSPARSASNPPLSPAAGPGRPQTKIPDPFPCLDWS